MTAPPTERIKCPVRKGVTHAPTMMSGHCQSGFHNTCRGHYANGCGCLIYCPCTHPGHDKPHAYEDEPMPTETPADQPLTQDQLDQLPTIDVSGIDTLHVGPLPDDAPGWVAQALAAAQGLNGALPSYAPEHWHDAARLLHELRKVTAMLGMLDSSLVQWLYLHGEHGLHQQVPGIPGSVNITRGRAKERWDAEGAVKAYVEAQLAETGEVPDPLQVMAWVLAVLPATQSTSLRKTPLREAGVDLEDYYWSEPGTLQVGLPRPDLT